MNTSNILDVLKKDFGINSLEEFDMALKNSKGLDIGIFTMPIKEVDGHDGGFGKDYRQVACK